MSAFLSAPLLSLRAVLAASAAFQTMTGTADATAAAQRVHLIAVPAGAVSPFALLDFGDFARERYAVTARPFEQRKGSSLFLYFRGEIDPSATNDAATIAYLDAVAAVLSDLELVAGTHSPDRLAIHEIEMEQAPERIQVEKRGVAGDYYESAFRLTYTRQPVPA